MEKIGYETDGLYTADDQMVAMDYPAGMTRQQMSNEIYRLRVATKGLVEALQSCTDFITYAPKIPHDDRRADVLKETTAALAQTRGA